MRDSDRLGDEHPAGPACAGGQSRLDGDRSPPPQPPLRQHGPQPPQASSKLRRAVQLALMRGRLGCVCVFGGGVGTALPCVGLGGRGCCV